MPTALAIHTALTAVGREPISVERAEHLADFLAAYPRPDAMDLDNAVNNRFSRWHGTEVSTDCRSYTTALAEAADPQLLAKRLTWEAEQLDVRAEYHEASQREFAGKAVDQPWYADGDGGFYQRARGAELCAQECRANAALKRADAEMVLRGARHRVAA